MSDPNLIINANQRIGITTMWEERESRVLSVSMSLSLVLAAVVLVASLGGGSAEYLIGVGSYDMTGPAAEVNLMGYANIEQKASGIHFRLRARTFIVAGGEKGPRFAFVNLDAGMASQLVNIKVFEKLKLRYGDLYTEENVAISGTHTHAGPGGYLQYMVYTITSMGFVQQSFDAIVNAVEKSIIQAHKNLKPGSIYIDQGDVDNAGINRSPSAYLMNPEKERARYTDNVDKQMTLLKFVNNATRKNIGSFNWYATHGTSMSRDNKLVSGDNKGAAARFFEDWFTATATSNPSNKSPKGSNVLWSSSHLDNERMKLQKAQLTQATRGKNCRKGSSQNAKVRKNDDSSFVGAFCQSNVGDVSPNVLGAFCTDTGKPCDFNHSSCNGNVQLCIGRGPGYPNEILSTRIIAERQAQAAVKLFTSAKEKLTGNIDYRFTYLNFTDIEVKLDENRSVKTCPAALGPGFAAGTTDGPGMFGFQQGDLEINPMWKDLRNGLQKPSKYQEECQSPKPVLLSTGEMFDPYAWAPAILPIQILRLGKLIILSVPGECTTMAGRRLREAVKETLISNGKEEFGNDTRIVIAGLTNTYSQYITTREEYAHQRYEAASTLYGPHTLSAYIQEFKKLAKSMATGQKLTAKGPSPPDLYDVQLRLLVPPLGEFPPSGVNFGDVKEDIIMPSGKALTKGDRVNATFWSANPRYDLLTEGTFALVERLEGKKWIPSYDDDDFCLYFRYGADISGYNGSATIEWEVPQDVTPGIYRLRHFGSSKTTTDSPTQYFTGASSSFEVS